MGHTISISGDSIQDLQNALAQLTGGAPAPTETTGGKKGPGRPPKAAAPSAAEQADDIFGGGEAAPAPAPKAAPAKTYTETEIRAKLQELMKLRTGDANEQVGLGRVRTALEKIGVQKVKDVPADKYGELAAVIDLM